MAKRLASTIMAATTAVATTVVGMIWPTIDHQLGIALLVGCGIAFIIAGLLWFWPNQTEIDRRGGVSQTTHGPHSPSYGNVDGGVHNYYGPPPPTARQERKYPNRGWDERNLQGLERVMRGVSAGQSGVGERVLRMQRERRERCPEMPMAQALRTIAARIRDVTDDLSETRQQFRQAAVEGRVDVWGQQDIPPQHLTDNRHRQVWTRIPPNYWNDYELNILSSAEENEAKWHTENEELPGRRGNRYWSLRVFPSDIDRRWPDGLSAE